MTFVALGHVEGIKRYLRGEKPLHDDSVREPTFADESNGPDDPPEAERDAGDVGELDAGTAVRLGGEFEPPVVWPAIVRTIAGPFPRVPSSTPLRTPAPVSESEIPGRSSST